jgi:hypothetical protein
MPTDPATAHSIYATLKAGCAGSLIENERITERRLKVSAAVGAPVGSTFSPPKATDGDKVAINTAEVLDNSPEIAPSELNTPPASLGAGYVRHWEGFQFSYAVFRPKAAGSVALRYEQEVQTDYVRRTVNTRFSGTVWANTEADADTCINGLLPAGTSWFTRDRRAERGKFWARLLGCGQARITDANTAIPKPDPEEGKPGYLYQVSFSASCGARLGGSNCLIEVELTDEYEHSGPRLVVHPTAFGRDVVQVCGYQSGRRTIRGSAVATTEATALDWCRTQWDLAFSPQIGTAPATRYRHPPRFAVRPTWVPLQSSRSARGDAATVAAYQASFDYTEVLPDFDANMTAPPSSPPIE